MCNSLVVTFPYLELFINDSFRALEVNNDKLSVINKTHDHGQLQAIAKG